MSVFLKMPLGLCETIVCNGLIRTLADSDVVYVPCRLHNMNSVLFMFRDNPRIVVVRIIDDMHMTQMVEIHKRAGDRIIELKKVDQWDEDFYEQAGVPFSARSERFHFERDPKLEFQAPAYPFVFVHQNSMRNWTINSNHLPKEIPVVHTYVSQNIFQWVAMIQAAVQIHSINDGFVPLIDGIGSSTDSKFIHKCPALAQSFPHYDEKWTLYHPHIGTPKIVHGKVTTVASKVSRARFSSHRGVGGKRNKSSGVVA